MKYLIYLAGFVLGAIGVLNIGVFTFALLQGEFLYVALLVGLCHVVGCTACFEWVKHENA